MKVIHVIEEGELSLLRITRSNLAQMLKDGNLTTQQKETINDAVLSGVGP